MSVFRPADAQELREIILAAAAKSQAMEIVAGGSKRGLGRPLQVAHTLDLSGLAGSIAYEPNELVLTAGAATPLGDIERALDGSSQMLAFEPADWGGLLGGEKGRQTLGGVLACNLSGPRRIKAGAARDHFLGFRAVSGRGEAFKAGGKVVKNVTGYDLSKLMAGSYGTLAVMSEVTVKVLPRPEKTRTVLLRGLDEARAVAAMTAALNSPHEVSGAAYLPAALAACSQVSYVAGAGAAITALRVEGPGPSVAFRCAALRRELGEFADSEELHSQNSGLLWHEVRDAEFLAGTPSAVIWRLSLPPAEAPAVIARVKRQADASFFLDWGGGLLWLAVAGAEDGGAAAVRAAHRGTGHATLLRAPAALREAVPVFEPQAPPLAALSARVKEGFDPLRILNPGRLYRGV